MAVDRAAVDAATGLVLIRHGITAWNRERRFQGQIDTPLDEQGRLQAERTSRRLAGWPIDAIYTSDLLRARQTAEPIAAAHGLTVRLEPRLRERHYGRFEGQTHDEIERADSLAYRRWRAREPDFALPGGGETLRTVQLRVETVLREMVRRHPGGTIVAVTHGGVLDCAFRIATGLALDAPRTHDLLNASLNRITWDGTAFRLVAWADADHLADAMDDIEAPTSRRPLR